ncbi:gas vesicle protein GvpK [Halobium salinum]|uniref:Gas vesicle protein GvpK n=1 Tax=Halobium salinum TaxID=1364940 RepID=A0ABD5PGV5_9EURY|nr:gas vesicle protein GvpK [Halobium salinum]
MTTIDIDGDDAADGLLTLVLAVVDLLVDALEREALRRMESGRLEDDEIERLGTQLANLEAEIEGLKAERGIEDEVARLRSDLDGLVSDTMRAAGGEAVFEEVTR